MQVGIKKLLDRVDIDIKKVSNKILDEKYEIDEADINIDIKHILEDMQSILDYIAVDIYEKYYGSHDGKRIYFPYTISNETDFKTQVNKYFPNLYDNHQDIYSELVKTQCFNDNSDWITKLKKLTNEVKHNELYITKIKKEKNMLMESDDTSMLIKGYPNIQKTENGYGVYGPASVYIGGEGRVSFYNDGTITVDNGTYNIDSKKTNNLRIEIYYENSVKSKNYNEDIIVLLNLILDKEYQLVSNIKQFI